MAICYASLIIIIFVFAERAQESLASFKLTQKKIHEILWMKWEKIWRLFLRLPQLVSLDIIIFLAIISVS